MKTQIFTTLFLILVLGGTMILAQQSSGVPSLDKRKLIKEQFGRSNLPAMEMEIPKNIPPYKKRSEENPLMLNAIIEDFQVNENAGPNGAEQMNPKIAADGNGNFVVTWKDERNGKFGGDIYAQRYSRDGIKIGNNFQVNEDEDGFCVINSHSITSDYSGNFVITWGNWEIYAQRFNSNGERLGSNFKVNNAVEGMDPSVSSDSSGNFVICWAASWTDIYAQRYSNDGSPIGVNFKVNVDIGNTSQYTYDPLITMTSKGNFLILWMWGNKRDGELDTYAQRYSNEGIPIGTNFKVLEGGYGSVASDYNGNFIVTWEKDSSIYAQRYLIDGTPVGINFKVNDTEGDCYSPSISTDPSGNFVITWNWNNYQSVSAQRYSSDGTPVGTNFKVNDTEESDYLPSISTDPSGNFMICWPDRRNGNSDIYAQRYSSNGDRERDNFKINDDSKSASQLGSSLAVDGNGNFIITWIDQRDYTNDIYAQRFLSDGIPLGSNFKVHDTEEYCYSHSISTDPNGNFVITWNKYRNEDSVYISDIYAQRYSADGNPIGNNFKVNDEEGAVFNGNPSISMDNQGDFVISWLGGGSILLNESQYDIYAQRYLNNGTKVGTNFIVNNIKLDFSQSAISSDTEGNFVIIWADYEGIFAQQYFKDGTRRGDNFKVNDGEFTYYGIYSLSVASDPNGDFTITWTGYLEGNRCICAQRYSSEGSRLGNNFKVNETDIGYDNCYGGTFISSDSSGIFIILWDEWTNPYFPINTNIYAQRFLSDGSKLGNNFIISNKSTNNLFAPHSKLWNGRIYNTWTDNRAGGTGWDIWANVLDWNQPVGVNDKEISKIPSGFHLYQNYPNPFNPTTKISWQSPVSSQQVLKVFDMLGNEVATLVDEYKPAGSYEIEFDASNLPSGVYFYQLKVGSFIETKKMMLLR